MLNFDRERLEAVWDRLVPLLPWFSLASGIVSALLLERSPEKAWMVAAAAGGVWISTGAALYVTGRSAQSGRLQGVLHFSSLLALQSLIQLALFFAGPFYIRAATWDVGHLAFLLLFAAAVVASTWDPIFYWVQNNRIFSSLLLSFATFAGLNCVLPMLGLSNWWSLITASLLACIGIPLLGRLRSPIITEAKHRLALDVGIALALPLMLAFGAGRLVPPAPMRLSEAAMGTKLANKWVADPQEELQNPSQLVCATAIAAPRGLSDKLFHVWSKDGDKVDEIALKVRGGREEGFRTWSIKKNFQAGTWRCQVITDHGQLLGGVSVEVSN